jgi:hypothetical protein
MGASDFFLFSGHCKHDVKHRAAIFSTTPSAAVLCARDFSVLAYAGFPQYLVAPTPAPTTPVPSQFGAPRLPHPTTPWGSSVNFTLGASSSVGISGAFVLPSADGREQGDVVTGTVSVDSFVAHALFDSGASYSFVSENFVSRAGLSVQRMGHPIVVSSANGFISSCSIC